MGKMKELAILMAQLEESKENNRHGLGREHWEYCQGLVASVIDAEQNQELFLIKKKHHETL